MPSGELQRLAERGLLKPEPRSRGEIEGLLRSGAARLADAQTTALSDDGRFDLAYNAAHALALAALRLKGFRAEKRSMVFQALPHTLGLSAAHTRLLSKCHDLRNRTEYEGIDELDAALLAGLVETAKVL